MTPVTELDARFSSEGSTPRPWEEGLRVLEQTSLYWLSTVRSSGRPHVTPLIAVWSRDAVYFCTGSGEQKAHNLAGEGRCALSTGGSGLHEGLDVVVEGTAVPETGSEALSRIAAAYLGKYGESWRFEVRDGAFHHPGGGRAEVFRLAPAVAFGFGRGACNTQTRWTFTEAGGVPEV